MDRKQGRTNGRDAQRLETRQRVFEAALVEFKQKGAADADIRVIVESAGVARGTFYFHFPTKEYVLAELERREDARISGQLERFFAGSHNLLAVLNEVVRAVVAMERRLGDQLFRELIALHFSPTRPDDDNWAKYQTIRALVAELERAQGCGQLFAEVDPVANAGFFLLGLYGVLTANYGSKRERAELLEKYVTSTVRSLEKR